MCLPAWLIPASTYLPLRSIDAINAFHNSVFSAAPDLGNNAPFLPDLPMPLTGVARSFPHSQHLPCFPQRLLLGDVTMAVPKNPRPHGTRRCTAPAGEQGPLLHRHTGRDSPCPQEHDIDRQRRGAWTNHSHFTAGDVWLPQYFSLILQIPPQYF